MTAKEKANELVDRFNNLLPCEGTTTGETPIECALICVDFTIKILYDDFHMHGHYKVKQLEEVKQEIEKL